MADFHYWRASYGGHKDYLAFGWTVHRDDTGKFYALKFRISKHGLMRETYRVAFAKRKLARARAYKWYEARRQTYMAQREKLEQQQAEKPKPTSLDKAQKKLAYVQKHLKLLNTRLKRTKTLIKKWTKKEKYYQKRVKDLDNL